MSAWENYHLEWSPDPLSVTNPTRLDITSYALAPSGPPIRVQAGVPPMGSAAQYATLWASLANNDLRFLYGNTSSPLYPNWKPGRRIWCYETVGCRRFELFAGYIQVPETDDHAEQGAEQYVTITAIDRLGRLGTGRAFISTLAEHIIYNGGAALKAHYPLNEPVGSQVARSVAPSAVSPMTVRNTNFSGTPVSFATMLAFGAQTPLVGDDVTAMNLTPRLDGAGLVVQESYPQVDWSPTIPHASGQTVTVAFWLDFTDATTDNMFPVFMTGSGGLSDVIDLQRSSGVWQVDFGAGAGVSSTFTVPGPGIATSMLYALRMTLPSGLVEYWRHMDPPVTATLSGSPPSSRNWSSLLVGDRVNGLFAHVQVYVDDGTGYTRERHLAQAAMGLSGLAGQTTGERITTLAQCAGIPTTELGLVDRGASLMQKATLAGQTPLAEMRIAETTEQGRLRTSGQGLLVFDQRTRRYNR